MEFFASFESYCCVNVMENRITCDVLYCKLSYAYCNATHSKITITLCCRISRQSDWTKLREGELPSVPSLYRGTFEVTEEPRDTFLHMKGWTKGVCFINGQNLGRYWKIGPQKTLYLPAPWLNKGHNEVCHFLYLLTPSGILRFLTDIGTYVRTFCHGSKKLPQIIGWLEKYKV